MAKNDPEIVATVHGVQVIESESGAAISVFPEATEECEPIYVGPYKSVKQAMTNAKRLARAIGKQASFFRKRNGFAVFGEVIDASEDTQD